MKINSRVIRLIYWPLAQEDGSGDFFRCLFLFSHLTRSFSCLRPHLHPCKIPANIDLFLLSGLHDLHLFGTHVSLISLISALVFSQIEVWDVNKVVVIMTRPMSTQYPIAFRADMKSYPLHSLMNAPSIFYFPYTFTARWRVAETWRGRHVTIHFGSEVDRCEESPSELSPGFARPNIKMTTARTERNCLWTLKCVTRWSKEEDWRFFTFYGNWNFGWYCRMLFL